MDKVFLSNYLREQIKLAREGSGITQEELGIVLGKTGTNISDIERGRLGIGAADLYLISEVLGKPISYFFPPSGQHDIGEIDISESEKELIVYYRQLTELKLKSIIIELIKKLTEYKPQKGASP